MDKIMNFKSIATGFALTIMSMQASCAQDNSNSLLASKEKIEACIFETAKAIDIPNAALTQENGLTRKFNQDGHIQAGIQIGIDGYMSDDPDRKTDQVNFFTRYTIEDMNDPINIYRAKQISFDAKTFYPYARNESGNAIYGHRDEIEKGRNFTPTTKEQTIENWVYSVVEAMDQRYKICMGFETDTTEIKVPDFPELNTP